MANCRLVDLKSLICLFVCLSVLCACARQGNDNPSAVQGSVPLETLKVGMPETVFKNAILTFAVDTNPTATAGGKTQYDSRTYNSKGGQYLAQCKGDKCFELQIYYGKNPISKEEALENVKQMLPSDAPAEPTKVDDSQVKSKSVTQPTEVHHFGDYTGELIYTDKSATKVAVVNVIDTTSGGSSSRKVSVSSEPRTKTKETEPPIRTKTKRSPNTSG